MKPRTHSNEQIQREQLLELGAILRQAREQQGHSLTQMARSTLIREKLLVAIETGDLHELPEPVYTRGLLRRYGTVLGLDGEALASQYFLRPQVAANSTSWKDSPAAQLRPLHLYAAYVVLMGLSIGGLSYVLQKAAPSTEAPPILDPEAVEQLMPQQAPTVASTAQPTAASTPATTSSPETPILVQVKFVQQSWVRIVADGSTAFEGILQQGDERSWSAQKSLTIRAGNAGGVVVSYNQGTAETMGEAGTVAEKTFRTGEAISLNLAN